VNLGGGLDGWGVFLVRRREDAEGDRYSGFKIQIGDLKGQRRVISSTTFRTELIER
jgi:hypothetical protein